jgi:hypothetical protein
MALEIRAFIAANDSPIEVERNNAFDLPFANIDGLVEELGLWPVLAVPGPWEMPDLIPQSAL